MDNQVSLVEQSSIPEQIGSLLQYQGVLRTLMQQTWQRRILIDTLRKTSGEEAKSSVMHQPLVTELFGKDIQTGTAATESSLSRLVTSPNDDPAIEANIEQYLLQKAITTNPRIGQITLNQLPAELFAVPDDPQSLDRATKMIQAEGNLTLVDFAQKYPSRLPLTESLLGAELDNTTAEIGIRVLTDPNAATEYQQAWIKQEQNSGQRIVFSPSYQRAADIIRSLERRNGKNRTIARSISYGPPGRGKSEFYRALNRMDNKSTLVISGRPYLSYEELVASPQIVGKEQVSSYIELAKTYQKLDDKLVTQMIVRLASKYSSGITDSADTQQLQELKKYWLKHIGISDDITNSLAQIENPDSPQEYSAKTELDGRYTEIKNTFIKYLLNLAAEPTLISKNSKQQEYLQGLIITADKLGTRVVIDEAEKMYTGQQKGSESFAGLEDILTRNPGETIRVGNIEHRFSDDFCIDLTMNIPDIPKHILSRFGERAFYFEETPYDRLAIAAVEMTGKDGKAILSNEAQEKLAFLLAGAWPVIDKIAQANKIPWDMRTLQSILSNLAFRGHLKGTSIATALNDFRGSSSKEGQGLSIIGKTLARFPVFENRISLSSILGKPHPETTTSAANEAESAPLHDILSSAPSGIDSPLKLNVVNLSEAQIKNLSAVANEKIVEPADQIANQICAATVTDSAGNEPQLVLTLPDNVNEILYRSKVRTDTDGKNIVQGDEALELVGSSAFGDIILVKKGTRYFAIDVFGTYSGDVLESTESISRRVSTTFENPSKIVLNPKGTFAYAILGDKDNIRLIAQKLGIKKEENKGKSTFSSFNVAGSPNQIPRNIQFTPDGNYALITFENGEGSNNFSVNILNVAETERTESPQFLLTETLEDNNWRLATFKNVLFLFNPKLKHGLRIS